jgi:threonine dehydratase
MKSFPNVVGVDAAAMAINKTFLDSPLIEQLTANEALGCRMFAKVETLNPIRSFKGRGTDWWMANLAPSNQLIVSASAGNFGQGLAYAAARRNRDVVIFSATIANPRKLDAMRRLGARVIIDGDDFDTAKAAARAYAQQNGALFVEDGDDRHIAEGAGTIAKEICEAVVARGANLEAVIVPLGNGALLSGMAVWIKAKMPSCRVIGVVATNAPAMKLSWEQSRRVVTASANTIADGIAVREPVDFALACMNGLVDDVLQVDEAAIRGAMAFCSTHFGLVVEAAGAVGIAALLAATPLRRESTVATVLCGGNALE